MCACCSCLKLVLIFLGSRGKGCHLADTCQTCHGPVLQAHHLGGGPDLRVLGTPEPHLPRRTQPRGFSDDGIPGTPGDSRSGAGLADPHGGLGGGWRHALSGAGSWCLGLPGREALGGPALVTLGKIIGKGGFMRTGRTYAMNIDEL